MKKKPIREWLETIADPTIREAAISQINENWYHWPKNGMVKRLADALFHFNDWEATKEGYVCWDEIQNLALKGKIETREVEAPEMKEGYIPYSTAQLEMGTPAPPYLGQKNEDMRTFSIAGKTAVTFNAEDYVLEHKEDGTIILKPKKVKVWIQVYKTHSNKMETLIHFNKQQLEDSINDGKNFGETLLEVIEREYEI